MPKRVNALVNALIQQPTRYKFKHTSSHIRWTSCGRRRSCRPHSTTGLVDEVVEVSAESVEIGDEYVVVVGVGDD